MNELSLFDPTPTEDLTDPAAWFMKHRIGGPDMGSLFLTDPEKAVSKLVEAGVPPPPMAYASTQDRWLPLESEPGSPLGNPGPQGTSPAAGVEGLSLPPWQSPTATYGRGGVTTPGPGIPSTALPPSGGTKDQTRIPSAPAPAPLPPPNPQEATFPDIPPINTGGTYAPGEALEAPAPESPGAPLDIRSPAQTAGTGGREPARPVPQPSDWQKVLAATKVLAPPAVSPVSTPSAPSPRVDSSPGVHFAPAPVTGHGGQINASILQVMQALRTPQGAALLSNLLRR